MQELSNLNVIFRRLTDYQIPIERFDAGLAAVILPACRINGLPERANQLRGSPRGCQLLNLFKNVSRLALARRQGSIIQGTAAAFVCPSARESLPRRGKNVVVLLPECSYGFLDFALLGF